MVPLLFLNYMAEILDEIKGLLQPLLEETDMFIVNMKIKPINNIRYIWTQIQVFQWKKV